MCFVFGTLIGIGMGIRIRNNVVAPQRMRAVVATSYKGLEAINVVEDILAPRIISPDQVLIQVKAAGIDYLDIKICEGYGRVMRNQLNKYNPNDWGELPVILGRDCSGVVVSVGMNVSKVQQGDEVWLAVPVHHQGTLSEYMVVSEKFVALKPSQLTHEGAAALPYNIMKAWDSLVNQAGLGEMSTAGKRVLIHAGVSGIGLVAIQLIRAWGGHVTTTVNSQMLPLAQNLGADDVITYDTNNFEKELLVREKFDVVLNPLGPILNESNLLEICTPGGLVVTAAHTNFPSDSYGYFWGLLFMLYIRMKYYFTNTPWVTGGKLGTLDISGKVLERVAPLVATGQLQAIVDKTYAAQDAEVAFHHITQGEPVGKTVIRFSAVSPYRNMAMAFCKARPIATRTNCYPSA
ncbi:Reticulon-4-interacting protein 1-like protein, mitochondrial [Armadillidium vulgare]|nr:Reticulon-4-interacting protein 1-like protein, mitochondrial [Armadillidium vulgare]